MVETKVKVNKIDKMANKLFRGWGFNKLGRPLHWQSMGDLET